MRTRKKDLKDQSIKSLQNQQMLTGDFEMDVESLRLRLGQNTDAIYREFKLKNTELNAALFYVPGLVDKEMTDKYVLRSLMEPITKNELNLLQAEASTIEYLRKYSLSVSDLTIENQLEKIITDILNGSVVLIIENEQSAMILGLKKEKSRNLEEPISEVLVRGPRIGFTESLNDNTAILRNLCANENLTFEKISLGSTVKKDIVVAYIKGITNTELVAEAIKRVKSIDIDYLPESGYVEQLIEDNYLSPFPQLQSTERPDRVMVSLVEGRVAIILDGTPFVLMAPVTLPMLLQSPDDYYERWIPGSLLRVLRYFSAFISLFGPALYISFISFHPGLIPTKLAITMASTREGVPYPAFIEALMMEIAIEILREAGLRLPKPIGPAIGIVGGLIIGEAAVSAGIVSPMMVIVVALTAISSFAIPQYSAGIAIRMLRFIAMLFASVYGLYGVVLFFLLVCTHLTRLESFGTPYLSPLIPLKKRDLKDSILRLPLFNMKWRPSLLQSNNPKRRG